jgi:hypothetical protein
VLLNKQKMMQDINDNITDSSDDDNKELFNILIKLDWKHIDELVKIQKNMDDETWINVQDEEGYTPLHHAILVNSVESVKLILETGKCDINLKNHMGETPLHLACEKRYVDIVKLLLLEQTCDVNSQDSRKQTPLHYITEINKKSDMSDIFKEFARFMLYTSSTDYNIDDSNNDIPAMYYDATIEITQLLVDHNKCDVNLQDINGYSALHNICMISKKRKSDMMKILLAKPGINVDLQDVSGRTPFYHACANQFGKVIKLLLAFNCDIGIQDIKGKTVLHMCSGGYHCSREIIWLILNNWKISRKNKIIILGKKDTLGRTALDIAYFSNTTEVIKLLQTL